MLHRESKTYKSKIGPTKSGLGIEPNPRFQYLSEYFLVVVQSAFAGIN